MNAVYELITQTHSSMALWPATFISFATACASDSTTVDHWARYKFLLLYCIVLYEHKNKLHDTLHKHQLYKMLFNTIYQNIPVITHIFNVQSPLQYCFWSCLSHS